MAGHLRIKRLNMAGKPKAASKKKQPAAMETSQTIEEQTQAFLSSGGKIEQINSGVSGQGLGIRGVFDAHPLC